MTRFLKSCKIKFVSVLIVVVVVSHGHSAPSSSNPESKHDGDDGPKAKRSANLMNFVGNMLQGYSGGSEGEWWDQKYPQSNYDYDDNFIDYDDRRGNDEFSEIYDLNSMNDIPEQERSEADTFGEWNYQYNEVPEEKPWFAIDGGIGQPFYENVQRNQYDHGPNSRSIDTDWNVLMPTSRNMEIDEMVWRNFFMTPPKGFGLPPSTPEINWIDVDGRDIFYDKGPKFITNEWLPEPTWKGFGKPDQIEPIPKDLKDHYLVFLVKKDEIVGLERNENKTEIGADGGDSLRPVFTILTCTGTKNETTSVRNTTVDATTENVIVGAGTPKSTTYPTTTTESSTLRTSTVNIRTTTEENCETTTTAEPSTPPDLSGQSSTPSTIINTSSSTTTTESTTCTEPASSTSESTPVTTELTPTTTESTPVTMELTSTTPTTTESMITTTELCTEATETTSKSTESVSSSTSTESASTTIKPTTIAIVSSIQITELTFSTTDSSTTVESTISTTESTPETTESSPSTTESTISTTESSPEAAESEETYESDN